MTLKWTQSARDDLSRLENYIANESIANAQKVVNEIIRTVKPLANFPKMGRTVPEEGLESIREIGVDNYRIIYQVEPEAVIILAILHVKQLYR